MRNLVLAASAAFLFAAPAAARDGSFYVGIDAGLLSASDMGVDRIVFREGGTTITIAKDELTEFDLKRGRDLAVSGGFDLGIVRLEAELGHKRAPGGDLGLDDQSRQSIEENNRPLTDADIDLDGKVSVTSVMGNVLADVGGEGGLGAYAGAGLGRARVKTLGDGDNAWAYQLIAGVRTALTGPLELGVEGRLFRTGKVEYLADDQDDSLFTADGDSRFKSTSLLVNLTYNFAGSAR